MIYDDLIRQILLATAAAVFIAFALWAVVKPHALAALLDYQLTTTNALNEFHAIYVGIFLAQAVLCAVACYAVQTAVLGNLAALFLLAQPFGRLVASLRWGWPHGAMLALFMVEILSGTALLLIQPSV